MKIAKKIILSSIVFSLLTFSAFAKDTKFGPDLTIKNKTNVSEILVKPELFVGKNLLIEGVALDVCKERGCWIKISSDKKKQSIKIKVDDGDMVFPADSIGKNIKAEGSIYKVEISKEDIIEMEKEKAKNKSTKFDPKSIKEGKTIYMFKPKSVVITDK